MIKKVLFFLISLLAGFGIFFWVIQFVGWQEIKSAFLIFSGWHGIAILLTTGLMLFFGALKWQVILKSQGNHLPLKVLITSYWAGFSVAFLAPMILFGGELLKVYFLKSKGTIEAPKAYASVIIDRILELTVYLLIIILGTVFFLFKVGLPAGKFGVILGLIILLFAGLTAFFYFKTIRKESIIKIFVKKIERNHGALETEKEVFSFFKLKRIEMWGCFGLTILRVLAVFLRTWLLVYFLLAKPLSFISIFSISSFYYLSYMIPIPTALGSHDAIQAFAFNALGLGANTGTVFAIIIRGAELIFALAGLLLLFRLGVSILGMNLFKKIGNLRGR